MALPEEAPAQGVAHHHHGQHPGYTDNRSNGYSDDRTRYEDGPNGVDHVNNGPKHQGTISQVYNPNFFKVANPGPLGLISFALTTFCLGLYQCGVGLPDGNSFGNVGPYQAVFGLAIFYGGTAQFIAGLMEFRVGNTFGTTVHVSYGAFWLSFAMFIYPPVQIESAYNGDARAYTVHIGIYLIAWAIFTLMLFFGALKTNIAILFTLFTLFLAFFFLSIAQFIHVTHETAALRVNRTGGAFALLAAAGAFYAGSSGLMQPETTWIRLPLGELKYHESGARKEKV